MISKEIMPKLYIAYTIANILFQSLYDFFCFVDDKMNEA